MTRPNEIGDLVRAVDAAKTWIGDEVQDDLGGLPLAGVLFLALIGHPGERGEVDSPLVLVLAVVVDTLNGWARSPTTSPAFASVPFGELDRLAMRVRVAIELARRGTASPPEPSPPAPEVPRPSRRKKPKGRTS